MLPYHKRVRLGLLATMLALTLFFIVVLFFFDAGVTGFVAAIVNITGTNSYNCQFDFYQGDNHVSFYCVYLSRPIETVLENISGEYYGAFSYVETDNFDPWKAYKQGLPANVIFDLTHINRVDGYIIEAYNDTPYFYYDVFTKPNTIWLYSGWNLIGYPDNTVQNITTVLAPIAGLFSEVRYYNASDSTWYYYYPIGPNTTLNYMEPFSAYWIYMLSNNQLTFS
ncbi:hypothetical protein GOV04_03120 [Candidatus Woesearchaeota archaeon]|nr:hypothetical protein [Candidatus Woesearchaeota archaeon]